MPSHVLFPRRQQLQYSQQPMTRGKKITDDVQWIVIRMATTMPKEDVSQFTGVSIRTVERILSLYAKTGGINAKDLRSESGTVGRKLQLSDIDLRVSDNYFSLAATDVLVPSWYC